MSTGQSIQDLQQRGKIDIKIAGSGGQGVILAGYILGAAAINANLSAVQMQSYGAAARGSNVSSDIMIQRTGPVNYPVVKKIDLLVAFTQQTFDDLKRKVKPSGIILVDQDLVEHPDATVPVFKLPATRIAQTELKNKVVANLVMLGGISYLLGFLPLVAMEDAIKEAVPEKFYALNRSAFTTGVTRAQDGFSPQNPPKKAKTQQKTPSILDE